MSTDARTQTGQPPPSDTDAAPYRPADAAPGQRQEPQTLIRESIKYRRRAQDAERRAEALEAEIDTLRQDRHERQAALEAELARARAEAETLGTRLANLERDRNLERELVKAGCTDAETALAVARERLTGGDPPDDPAAFAKALLAEKPHLCGGAATRGAPVPPPLPPPTAGAKPMGNATPRRNAQRLAEQARQTGSPTDVLAYMKARRTVGTQMPARTQP